MILKRFLPIFLMFIAVSFVGAGVAVDYADAKSRMGGRMFKSTPKSSPAKTSTSATQSKSSGFKSGLAGGLLGGALGGMLFGSMMGGSGMGMLPILILAGVGFFLFKKMGQAKNPNNRPRPGDQFGQSNQQPQQAPFSTEFGNEEVQTEEVSAASGLAQIKATDPGFHEKDFQEIASDVFFQVQAGWMRRDLPSYRHLLGDTLAGEYEQHFAEMAEKGIINKLESIAVRGIDIVEAGSDDGEDFVTIMFTASLLDYTVDEKSGDVIEGSMTTPIKFNERWTWARPTGTNDWKLEGIDAE